MFITFLDLSTSLMPHFWVFIPKEMLGEKAILKNIKTNVGLLKVSGCFFFAVASSAQEHWSATGFVHFCHLLSSNVTVLFLILS